MQLNMQQPVYQPLYEQIKKMLTQSLIDGEWVAGAMIPSEMDLANRYKVSQGTVRKAIDDLVADNIMMRRQGKGTFVVSHAEEGVKLRFLRLADGNGTKIFPRHQLLSCTRSKAPAGAARRLGIKTGSAVIESGVCWCMPTSLLSWTISWCRPPGSKDWTAHRSMRMAAP